MKERIDRSDSAIEGQDSSSAADDIAIEGQDSSSAADKSAIESPDSSSACGNGNEGLPQGEKSNQSLPPKPFSYRKPVTNWADEISEGSEENVNMDNQSDRNSSAIRADYVAIRAEINPGFSVVNPEDAIVRVSLQQTTLELATYQLQTSFSLSPKKTLHLHRHCARETANRTGPDRTEPN